ncbi:GntR family transcriptional regulator [Actinacidiphila yeochonensis]|uniref:GntR family transcriptional regulator n=1 Tax=Actinacidiphila yeochonensis TaxID=89050 RepID=UPI00056943E8|nr:UTRA domain-containing protein [Actinacidiphila yeochonensis]
MAGEWTSTSAPYVAPRPGETWAEEAAARGRKGTQRIVEAAEVAAPAEVAGPLGLPDGATVIVRRRVMYLDERPCELTDTYYPVEVARGTPLAGTAKIKGGAVAYLASLGRSPARVREEVSARLADAAERAALGLAPGEPVLCLARVTLDERERPFQVDLSVFPAAGQRLRYELRTE